MSYWSNFLKGFLIGAAYTSLCVIVGLWVGVRTQPYVWPYILQLIDFMRSFP